MNKLLPLLTFSILLLVPVGVHDAFADILYESATLGPIGQTGGVTVGFGQLVGSRFTIDEPVQVTEIGGHLVDFGGAPVFGAIFELSGPGALPTGNPINPAEVVAFTTFTAPDPSDDVSVPLSITLQPGVYALVFGGDDHFPGANGHAAMTLNNPVTPEGVGSFHFFNAGPWINGGFSDARFTVNGNVIGVVAGELLPIESTSLILAGAQSFSWMIPVVLSVLGIGLFVFRKSENS